MSEKAKRLTRSKSDRMVAGVAGGLAEYFNIDPVIFRAAFVLFALFDGAGVLIYIVMWIIVPEEGKENEKKDLESKVKEVGKEAEQLVDKHVGENNSHQVRNVIGVIIIIIGAMALLRQFFPISWLGFHMVWPILIVVFGFLLITKKG
ncbi:MAG: PspC domain-containing protein [Patescibacteria group bacterium]